MQAPPGSTTTFCPFCNTHLSYPLGVTIIQCPTCQNQYDPTQGQCRCIGCSSILSYPPTALFVQCPRCGRTQDPRSGQPIQQQQNSQQQQAAALQQQLLSQSNFGSMAGMQVMPSNLSINPAAAAAAAAAAQAGLAAAHNNYPAMGVMQHTPMQGQQANQFKSKAPKKRKDPNAPKAVRNAYMIFCQTTRSQLKQQHPELSFGKLGGRMGEMWRLMSASEKAPYEKLALEDRDRYRQEMLKWQQSGARYAKPHDTPNTNNTSNINDTINSDANNNTTNEAGKVEISNNNLTTTADENNSSKRLKSDNNVSSAGNEANGKMNNESRDETINSSLGDEEEEDEEFDDQQQETAQ